jgi:hypothetical protein
MAVTTNCVMSITFRANSSRSARKSAFVKVVTLLLYRADCRSLGGRAEQPHNIPIMHNLQRYVGLIPCYPSDTPAWFFLFASISHSSVTSVLRNLFVPESYLFPLK